MGYIAKGEIGTFFLTTSIPNPIVRAIFLMAFCNSWKSVLRVSAQSTACNFIKKETLAQRICLISKVLQQTMKGVDVRLATEMLHKNMGSLVKEKISFDVIVWFFLPNPYLVFVFSLLVKRREVFMLIIRS